MSGGFPEPTWNRDRSSPQRLRILERWRLVNPWRLLAGNGPLTTSNFRLADYTTTRLISKHAL